ncbi:IucA/IucC family siderophore biosynthesis protein [Paenibacillus sp. L3-i20]|uniref:IucA/IucC family protein n=1 Tax=Paenibacillus sp. L3-i20 TaxID=2905833 RepID=UPI001EE08199|nr:IucA/IucC family protein [Paenibacillus sp. L3-i20]GKU76660.1 petrobactin biosynthesis protein AsbA [Paenibacillus sp. L3-i20]
MIDAKKLAEQVSIQSFLNCYLRETGQCEPSTELSTNIVFKLKEVVMADSYFICHLNHLNITLYAGIQYYSLTGRHKFHFPIIASAGNGDEPFEVDYLFLVTMIAKDLLLEAKSELSYDDLVLRVIQSCQQIQCFIEGRDGDEDELYGEEISFLQAEQSLLLGHLIHPTPKSRQGISDEESAIYSPELKGSFELHYFRAHQSIVKEDCALPGRSATSWIKEELAGDGVTDGAFISQYCMDDNYTLIPLHPLQAKHVLKSLPIQQLMKEGLLQDIGTAGRAYSATSSLRSVYEPNSSFMVKGSIPVKITNSLRVNKYKELERGVEVKRLLDTEIGERLAEAYPSFEILSDPAFVTVHLHDAEESGFETIMRDNPFRGIDAKDTNVTASLFQDAVYGNKTRIETIIRKIAAEENLSVAEVSLKWFRSYLDVSLKPMVWLYLNYGIALEAHQQNSVVRLVNGYPAHFYYRDNQGYYFCQSTFDQLNELLPGVSSSSHTVCEDHVADERFRYYLIFNHMFGVINGLGSAALISEQVLLSELRSTLEYFVEMDRKPSQFLSSLLHSESLPCKANLLTRLYDMDELVGAMESQSIYVPIRNPLLAVEKVTYV